MPCPVKLSPACQKWRLKRRPKRGKIKQENQLIMDQIMEVICPRRLKQ